MGHTHTQHKQSHRQTSDKDKTHTNTRAQNEQRRNDCLLVEVAVVAPKIVVVNGTGAAAEKIIGRIGRLGGVGALRDCVPRVWVVGAAVPAAVCRWGLCPRCSGVGRCLSGVYISSKTHKQQTRTHKHTHTHTHERGRISPRVNPTFQ